MPEPDKPEDEWFVALEAWVVDRASWDVEKLGPRPNEPNHRIPLGVAEMFAERLRKREERRRERKAADSALRDKLVAACHGNIVRGYALDDLAPIRAILQDVPIDHVLIGLKRVTDRRIDPRATPIASWRDERFLRAVARSALLDGLLPRPVATWKAAGMAPGKAVERAEASTDTPAAPTDAPATSSSAPETSSHDPMGGDGGRAHPRVWSDAGSGSRATT